MFVILIFFDVTHRPQLDTYPPPPSTPWNYHKKADIAPSPNRYVLFETHPRRPNPQVPIINGSDEVYDGACFYLRTVAVCF